MPLYTCMSTGREDASQRRAIATAITEAHCKHTGAPEEFVHVFFNPLLGTGHRDALRIVGSIRSGRDEAVKSALRKEIIERAADALAVANARVAVTFRQFPANWAMEGGTVLPQPGTEAAWMEKHWRPPPSTGNGENDDRLQPGGPRTDVGST